MLEYTIYVSFQMEMIITPVLTHLLKQLQAVCIIVICKVDDSCLAAVGVEGLP